MYAAEQDESDDGSVAGACGHDDDDQGGAQHRQEEQERMRRRDESARQSAGASLDWPLNESDLDYQAETRGWDKIDVSSTQAPMASYRKDDKRLNFYLSTGTVASFLDHPRRGKDQLFRGSCTRAEAVRLLDNPREHTGKGYHTRQEKKRRRDDDNGTRVGEQKRQRDNKRAHTRVCAACRLSHGSEMFTKNQRSKGSAARCKKCVGALP